MENKDQVIGTVIKNGPLKIKGNITIEMPNGDTIEKGPITSICRCGESKNQPFCDGTHKSINWQG